MNSKFRLTASGSIVLVAAAALALGGCGRKGGLDLPPTRTSAGPVVAAPADNPSVFNSAFGRKSGLDSPSAAPGETGADGQKATVFNPTFGTEAPPPAAAPAPKGDSKKSFILDPLLDK